MSNKSFKAEVSQAIQKQFYDILSSFHLPQKRGFEVGRPVSRVTLRRPSTNSHTGCVVPAPEARRPHFSYVATDPSKLSDHRLAEAVSVRELGRLCRCPCRPCDREQPRVRAGYALCSHLRDAVGRQPVYRRGDQAGRIRTVGGKAGRRGIGATMRGAERPQGLCRGLCSTGRTSFAAIENCGRHRDERQDDRDLAHPLHLPVCQQASRRARND